MQTCVTLLCLKGQRFAVTSHSVHPKCTDRLIDISGSLKRVLNVSVADFPRRIVEKCHVHNAAKVRLRICCILFNDTLNRPVNDDSE
jgi:hypothetical protein